MEQGTGAKESDTNYLTINFHDFLTEFKAV